MSSQERCGQHRDHLASAGFRARAWLDRALNALATGANAVAFIGALRVGLDAWPRDNANPSKRTDW